VGARQGRLAGSFQPSSENRLALAEANREYERRFGHIYIICATGKTADEMLTILKERLQNDADKELRVAAEEQRRITHLRLQKIL
jgi:OHCU decarboxylase